MVDQFVEQVLVLIQIIFVTASNVRKGVQEGNTLRLT